MNGWDNTIEKLLANWSQQISINENEYRKHATNYKKLYYIFESFCIITQTGSLTTLINAIANDSGIIVYIIVAVLDSLNLVVAALSTFFNFAGISEKYYEAAKDHGALSRFIDSTLSLPRKDRGHSKEVVLSIREQFNNLIKDNTLQLPPNKIIHRLDMCIYEDPNNAIGNSSIGLLASPRKDDISIIIDKSNNSSGNSSTVNLPDLDGEHVINHEQKCNIRKQLIIERKNVENEIKNKGILSNLEYQWGRLANHDEE